MRLRGEKLYRYFYPLLALVAALFIALVLSAYAQLLQDYITIGYHWRFEFLMVCGQVLFQLFFIGRRSLSEKVRYSYRLIGVSFLGAVLLLPALYLDQIRDIRGFVALCYFFCVVGIMFVTHQQIVRRLCLPHHLCYTWVLYRVLILIFIIKYP